MFRTPCRVLGSEDGLAAASFLVTNRKRIDDAIQDRKDMERVLSVMEKKGVALTESDRRVIGHFWQKKLFREKKGAAE